MSRVRQADALWSLMIDGWVGPLDALNRAGCLRLGARIHDIRRQGIDVEERWVEGQDGKRWKEFRHTEETRAIWLGNRIAP